MGHVEQRVGVPDAAVKLKVAFRFLTTPDGGLKTPREFPDSASLGSSRECLAVGMRRAETVIPIIALQTAIGSELENPVKKKLEQAPPLGPPNL